MSDREKLLDEVKLSCRLINDTLKLNNISPGGAVSGTLTMLTHFLEIVGVPLDEIDEIRQAVFLRLERFSASCETIQRKDMP
jgi:hypothetical protein